MSDTFICMKTMGDVYPVSFKGTSTSLIFRISLEFVIAKCKPKIQTCIFIVSRNLAARFYKKHDRHWACIAKERKGEEDIEPLLSFKAADFNVNVVLFH